MMKESDVFMHCKNTVTDSQFNLTHGSLFNLTHLFTLKNRVAYLLVCYWRANERSNQCSLRDYEANVRLCVSMCVCVCECLITTE